MPTMPERLQGSYEDVEYELNHMRQNCKDHGSPYIQFVGGDGLSIDRIQHLLATKSHIYLDCSPAIIPVLGLSPHGEFHVCHAGYRLFSPIIQVFARHLL
mmetsp:Transcript_12708/g.22262  ORF Transcript_12708/g.22262 Transcript_12708/m.22262 type:complete len:100 (-) Transcript_12708:265-564(-)